MRAGWLGLALLALVVGAALAQAFGPELRALIDGFLAHRRVAIGYLRTGNADLGAVEIERLQERWVHDRGALTPAAAQDQALAVALADTEGLIRDSRAAADTGDAERSRLLLERAAAPLTAWRRARGIRLFADCIAEIGTAYERLDVHRLQPPDLADRAAGDSIVAAAAATAAALRRCEDEALPAQREEPEFRRLFDGMFNSLRQVPDAVEQRDRAYLHRLLIEQRSFERLLAFRFG